MSSFDNHLGYTITNRYRVNLVGRSGPGARVGAAHLDQVCKFISSCKQANTNITIVIFDDVLFIVVVVFVVFVDVVVVVVAAAVVTGIHHQTSITPCDHHRQWQRHHLSRYPLTLSPRHIIIPITSSHRHHTNLITLIVITVTATHPPTLSHLNNHPLINHLIIPSHLLYTIITILC